MENTIYDIHEDRSDLYQYIYLQMLLDEKNVKAADVAKATGLQPSVFTDWKKGRSLPKLDKLQKIANYFGCSVERLTTGKDNKQFSISENKAKVLAEITRDDSFFEYIDKLLKLPIKKRMHVLELIDLLGE